MESDNFIVYVFFAYSDEIFNFQQKEDEILGIYKIPDVYNEKLLHNLYFLIPFGIYGDPVDLMNLIY